MNFTIKQNKTSKLKIVNNVGKQLIKNLDIIQKNP